MVQIKENPEDIALLPMRAKRLVLVPMKPLHVLLQSFKFQEALKAIKGLHGKMACSKKLVAKQAKLQPDDLIVSDFFYFKLLSFHLFISSINLHHFVI
jgi:hypothetical protein